jgi:hypothetical protein
MVPVPGPDEVRYSKPGTAISGNEVLNWRFEDRYVTESWKMKEAIDLDSFAGIPLEPCRVLCGSHEEGLEL